MQIDRQRLSDFVPPIFVHCDAAEDDAREVAEHLVEENLKGHDSHGVGMIPTYVNNALVGHLNVQAKPEVIKDRGALLLVNAQTGFGQVAGRKATELAIERVASTGVVCMGVRNCRHLGRIGTYGELCGNAGLVSVHFVNVVGHGPVVSPFGGMEVRMTTHPFCCVVPRPNDTPLVLDMATSAVAMGKIRVAYNKGTQAPKGALLDHEGRPSTDPAVLCEQPTRTLGPFGGHKRYGLAVMCELLGGGLAGEWTAQPGNPRENTVVNHMLQFVFDPAAFGGQTKFSDEVTAMVDYLHSTEPAAGVDKVRVPGEPELESRAERLRPSIPIDDTSWEGIGKAAQRTGMTMSDLPN